MHLSVSRVLGLRMYRQTDIYPLPTSSCCTRTPIVWQECYKKGFVYDGLVKVDNKIKHHIINVFAKEFTDMSATIAKSELKTLR